MAGRIRTIKPEMLEDEHAAGLSHAAWRLWVSCLLLADDYGNLRANPTWLLGQVFWNSSRESRETVEKAIDELATCKGGRGLVDLYQNHGQPYLHITGWNHQKVDHPGKPRCPGPDDGDSRESRESLSNDSRESRALPVPVPVPPTSTSTSISAPSPKASEPPVFELPLAKGGETFAVTKAMVDEWTGSFPGVDIDAEIRKCVQWNRDNPKRRKTRKGAKAHIGGWLGRVQDRGKVNGGQQAPAFRAPPYHTTYLNGPKAEKPHEPS